MLKSQTVFVSGNFNILHPGHLRLLRFAREMGDRLIVGVNSDKIGGDHVHVGEQLRLDGIKSNNWVTEAFLMDEPVTDVLARLKPDIVVKGKEFENVHNVEKRSLKEYGGKLVFSSGEAAFSSLDLIRKNFSGMDRIDLLSVQKFASRHDFSFDSLIDIIGRLSDVNVCVVGDLIVDEYITCDPLGMSQEDPTIVVTPIDTQRFIGGAGIVAAHAAGLGANSSFISVAGNDPIREYAETALSEYDVQSRLLVDENRPTTLKQRFRAQNKTLLRVSHLHQGSIGKKLQNKIEQHILDLLPGLDLLVFSDFNYGCLPQPLIEKIVDHCNGHNVTIIADSQCSSQVGDVSRFKGMNLLTPTEREVRVSLRNQEDGLVVIAERLRQKAMAQNIILTLGAEGVLLHIEDEEESVLTDRLPALNYAPIDVAGAGDSMLITSGLTLAAGGSAWQAAALGSVAAGIQVSRMGNKPLSKQEFMNTFGKINT
ncbi:MULTISPECIES: PfkB family carbohydrate kinase [unclassified Oleiphilus]|uniref:PfkB family carbohydrate kinase n=1 Tax=unclassified Oleiphilus TaxID=2631174 RepID=UPI0007C24368|nr:MULTISPECIES: PfkB family carbohydrate kinase [unclassified Oleiphilus]KZZ35262.1 ADP-heptose synthase [Oleiphilus sp. HI0117]KZZ61429.1 ADP-heptose synthase [Oleiphilus sp. HI0123]